jgi:hypothetical protein
MHRLTLYFLLPFRWLHRRFVFSSSLSFIVIARQYALRHDRSNST